MKKYAFTLAETLLTMSIIGICAAMLITTIKNINPSGQADAIMAKNAKIAISIALNSLKRILKANTNLSMTLQPKDQNM